MSGFGHILVGNIRPIFSLFRNIFSPKSSNDLERAGVGLPGGASLCRRVTLRGGAGLGSGS